MWVKLSEEDEWWCIQKGNEIRAEAERLGLDNLTMDDDPFAHCLGTMAERAAAVAFDSEVVAVAGETNNPDLKNGCEVRSKSRPENGLCWRPGRDRENVPFILVDVIHRPFFRIAGWLWGGDEFRSRFKEKRCLHITHTKKFGKLKAPFAAVNDERDLRPPALLVDELRPVGDDLEWYDQFDYRELPGQFHLDFYSRVEITGGLLGR